jgi:hypothetical protein
MVCWSSRWTEFHASTRHCIAWDSASVRSVVGAHDLVEGGSLSSGHALDDGSVTARLPQPDGAAI